MAASFTTNKYGHRQYENEADARAYAISVTKGQYDHNSEAGKTAIQSLTQAYTAPKTQQTQAGAPSTGGGASGPGVGGTTELPGMGGGGGGSVSYEGYEPTMRSQLNPNLGRRLQAQAFSALAAVRNPY